jgi:hypothetical protein
MTRSTADQDYRDLALKYRPRSAAEMRCAIHEMASRGMGPHEIATAAGLAVTEIRRILGYMNPYRQPEVAP